jgi:hypothetical protein
MIRSPDHIARAHWPTVVIGLLLAACESTPVPAAPTAAAADRAVQALVAAHPGWRVAEARDNGDSAGLRRQREREPGFEPYRRQGDWNRDGRADLAVVLVRDTVFRAYWLPGTPSGFGPAEELGETPDLRQGGLFELDRALVIGPFESDALWVYRWNASTRRLEPAPEDE